MVVGVVADRQAAEGPEARGGRRGAAGVVVVVGVLLPHGPRRVAREPRRPDPLRLCAALDPSDALFPAPPGLSFSRPLPLPRAPPPPLPSALLGDRDLGRGVEAPGAPCSAVHSLGARGAASAGSRAGAPRWRRPRLSSGALGGRAVGPGRIESGLSGAGGSRDADRARVERKGKPSAPTVRRGAGARLEPPRREGADGERFFRRGARPGPPARVQRSQRKRATSGRSRLRGFGCLLRPTPGSATGAGAVHDLRGGGGPVPREGVDGPRWALGGRAAPARPMDLGGLSSGRHACRQGRGARRGDEVRAARLACPAPLSRRGSRPGCRLDPTRPRLRAESGAPRRIGARAAAVRPGVPEARPEINLRRLHNHGGTPRSSQGGGVERERRGAEGEGELRRGRGRARGVGVEVAQRGSGRGAEGAGKGGVEGVEGRGGEDGVEGGEGQRRRRGTRGGGRGGGQTKGGKDSEHCPTLLCGNGP